MSTCPICQTRFDCGVVDTDNPAACWCMALPRVATKPEDKKAINQDARCLCPNCLRVLRARSANDNEGAASL